MSYEYSEKLKAMKAAEETIGKLRMELGFVRGKTDCWSLVCEYDLLLRAGVSRLKELNLQYNSEKEFLYSLRKRGFKSFQSLMDYSYYDEVQKQDLGDVGVLITPLGLRTFSFWKDNKWVTGSDDKKDRTMKLALIARPRRN